MNGPNWGAPGRNYGRNDPMWTDYGYPMRLVRCNLSDNSNCYIVLHLHRFGGFNDGMLMPQESNWGNIRYQQPGFDQFFMLRNGERITKVAGIMTSWSIKPINETFWQDRMKTIPGEIWWWSTMLHLPPTGGAPSPWGKNMAPPLRPLGISFSATQATMEGLGSSLSAISNTTAQCTFSELANNRLIFLKYDSIVLFLPLLPNLLSKELLQNVNNENILWCHKITFTTCSQEFSMIFREQWTKILLEIKWI